MYRSAELSVTVDNLSPAVCAELAFLLDHERPGQDAYDVLRGVLEAINRRPENRHFSRFEPSTGKVRQKRP